MKLSVKPEYANFFYQVFFSEPMLDEALDEPRITLIKKLLKSFDLRLNDIKFDVQSPSNNFIHFLKFYGSTLFDVSYGLEEISAKLERPDGVEQVADLFGRLFEVFKNHKVSQQKMRIQVQCSTELDAELYLKKLNPDTPKKFDDFLFGRGVIFDLKNPEYDLTSHIVLSSSLFVEGGVYLSVEYEFFPNKYDFESAFKIIKDQNDFILEELNLIIDAEI